MDGPQARVATGADAALVTRIVADAFRDDPLWSWAMRRDDGRTDHHDALWEPFVEGALRYPWTWVAEGDAAVAVWIPPGGDELTDEQEALVERRASDLLGAGAEVYFATFERFEQHHPHDEPHYYLSLLATALDQRGRGVGMALLRTTLQRIDEEGVPAYLESSNPANDARYRSVGFVPRDRFHAPGPDPGTPGPVVTTMWRPVGG